MKNFIEHVISRNYAKPNRIKKLLSHGEKCHFTYEGIHMPSIYTFKGIKRLKYAILFETLIRNRNINAPVRFIFIVKDRIGGNVNTQKEFNNLLGSILCRKNPISYIAEYTSNYDNIIARWEWESMSRTFSGIMSSRKLSKIFSFKDESN